MRSKKGSGGALAAVIVAIIIAIIIYFIASMYFGSQTHPFWEIH